MPLDRSRVRGFGPGMESSDGWYFRWAPNFGFGCPWRNGRRLRWAAHHGLQKVRWTGNRWCVERQMLGRSRVKGERYV